MKYRTPTKAVITDAGCASRFLPLTKTIPKAMLPLGNKPIMQIVVEECMAAGIKEIIIVATAKGRPLYDDYFHDPATPIQQLMQRQGKDDRFQPVQTILNDFPKITVIEQDADYPYGNGSPFASARQFIDDDEAFLAIYSDDVVYGQPAVKDLMDSFAEHPDAVAIIAGQLVPHDEIKKYAAIDYDTNTDVLNDLVEKPDPDAAASDLASYGRYLLTPEIFQYLDPELTGKDGELWTADAIARLIPTGKVYVKRTSGRWMTTGDPRNYALANAQYILDHEDYVDEVRATYIEN